MKREYPIGIVVLSVCHAAAAQGSSCRQSWMTKDTSGGTDWTAIRM